MPFGGRCRGVTQPELAAWNGLLFVLVVMAVLNDPSSGGFWIFVGVFFTFVKLPFFLTPAGALQRQQHHDATFGKEALAKFPRY